MANEHDISLCTVHDGSSAQPPSMPDCLTRGTADPRITRDKGPLPRQENPTALAGRKSVCREIRIPLSVPATILAGKTPVESDVSIGPLLAGITMLALMRRLRRCP